jgi:hypothetical protein
VQETLGQTLDKAKRLVAQTASRKAVDNRAKLYSWHATEVECISKVQEPQSLRVWREGRFGHDAQGQFDRGS